MLTQQIIRFHNNTRGAVAILWGLLLPVIVGLSALGVEVGLWYGQQRDYQTAADAAVLAAAYTVSEGGDSTDMATAAQEEAENNGFAVSGNNTLTISTPPSSGSYAGNSDYIEVSMTAPSSLMFASLFLDNDVEITVRAVAVVSASAGSGDACVLALNNSMEKSLLFSGNANMDMSGCVVASNSTDSNSIQISGSATVTAESLQTAGDYTTVGAASLTTTTDPTTGAAEVTDPYEDLEVPAYAGCDETEYKVKPNQNKTISPIDSSTPYVLCDGLDVKGTLTLDPGIYVIDGGTFNVNSTASLSGSDVTLILTSSSGSDHAKYTMNGGASIDLSAPSSGDYAGVLMYRDRDASDEDNTMNGNSSAVFNGALYFPSSTMKFAGNSDAGGSACTQLIADNVQITGSTSITSSGCEAAGATLATLSGSSSINLVE
ncbi:pilus assembly protein TadG-related protein [Magnetovibrio sp. PR-2]|uniref:pilus assembly protein TadG-related protein n=1 Tax=Magnetovibrio sp. PR-2 TaxID=3120356 RepID=UPI002FCE636F